MVDWEKIEKVRLGLEADNDAKISKDDFKLLCNAVLWLRDQMVCLEGMGAEVKEVKAQNSVRQEQLRGGEKTIYV